MLKRYFTFIPAFLILFFPHITKGINYSQTINFEEHAKSIYAEFNDESLSFNAFQYGLKGYYYVLEKGLIQKKNLLSLVDYSKSSAESRLFILDLNAKKVLYKSLAAHGKNSGIATASEFSNELNSNQSSLGFYITGESYTGKHGLSLRLDGLEPGFNTNARERSIVIHGADYVCTDFIAQNGYLGRSHGCPALPNDITATIIDLIKEQSCLFIYHPEKNYLEKSEVINNKVYTKHTP